MKKFGSVAAFAIASVLPLSAAAQQVGNISSLSNIISTIRGLINVALPILIAFAVVWFVWSMVQVLLAGDAEEKKDKAKSNVMYGVIAIFAMVSIWGLVNILDNTFGLENENLGNRADEQLPSEINL